MLSNPTYTLMKESPVSKSFVYTEVDGDTVTKKVYSLEPDPTVSRQLSGCVDILCGMVIGIFTYGFCIMKMWEWFLTPQFGIPAPSLFICYGLRMICSSITHSTTSYPIYQKKTSIMLSAIVIPLTILVVGYVTLNLSRNF